MEWWKVGILGVKNGSDLFCSYSQSGPYAMKDLISPDSSFRYSITPAPLGLSIAAEPVIFDLVFFIRRL
jgi:hypothetical protein